MTVATTTKESKLFFTEVLSSKTYFLEAVTLPLIPLAPKSYFVRVKPISVVTEALFTFTVIFSVTTSPLRLYEEVSQHPFEVSIFDITTLTPLSFFT